jgi:hypothetical protein
MPNLHNEMVPKSADITGNERTGANGYCTRCARNMSYLKVMNCCVFIIVISVICCAHNGRSFSNILKNTDKFICIKLLVHTTLIQTCDFLLSKNNLVY